MFYEAQRQGCWLIFVCCEVMICMTTNLPLDSESPMSQTCMLCSQRVELSEVKVASRCLSGYFVADTALPTPFLS